MNENMDMGEPVRVVRDVGYSKIKLLSLEYRNKVKKRVEDPNIVTGKYKLK